MIQVNNTRRIAKSITCRAILRGWLNGLNFSVACSLLLILGTPGRTDAQLPWSEKSEALPLETREKFFDSHWGRLPTTSEIDAARSRLVDQVLLADLESSSRREDGSEVIRTLALQNITVHPHHAKNLSPGEAGFGTNQIVLVASFQAEEETRVEGKPAGKKLTKFQSVFRLMASGPNRDQFEFQFEFSQPGEDVNQTLQAVFSPSWIDFSGAVVPSALPPVTTTKEPAKEAPSVAKKEPTKRPEPVKQPIDRVPDEEEELVRKSSIKLPKPVKPGPSLDGQPRLVGLSTESAGRPAARNMGVESPLGSVVMRVASGSAAEQAGLKTGDLITAVNDIEINDLEDLEALILTSPVGSRQRIRMYRSNTQTNLTTDLEIRAGDSSKPSLVQYSHPLGGWTLGLPPLWKIDPYSRREEKTERVYDLIKSSNENYQFHIYHDFQIVKNVDAAFIRFVSRARRMFGDYEIGRVQFGKISALFVAGQVGEETRRVVYRLAVIIEGRLFEIDVNAPASASPEELPRAIGAILGTLND